MVPVEMTVEHGQCEYSYNEDSSDIQDVLYAHFVSINL